MEQFEKTRKEKVKFFYFFHNCQERYDMISIIDQGSFDQRSPKFIMAATKIANVKNSVPLRECPKKKGKFFMTFAIKGGGEFQFLFV